MCGVYSFLHCYCCIPRLGSHRSPTQCDRTKQDRARDGPGTDLTRSPRVRGGGILAPSATLVEYETPLNSTVGAHSWRNQNGFRGAASITSKKVTITYTTRLSTYISQNGLVASLHSHHGRGRRFGIGRRCVYWIPEERREGIWIAKFG